MYLDISDCVLLSPSTVKGEAPVSNSYVSTPNDHQSTACKQSQSIIPVHHSTTKRPLITTNLNLTDQSRTTNRPLTTNLNLTDQSTTKRPLTTDLNLTDQSTTKRSLTTGLNLTDQSTTKRSLTTDLNPTVSLLMLVLGSAWHEHFFCHSKHTYFTSSPMYMHDVADLSNLFS